MAYTTIKKPSDYFNTVTYTGTAGEQTISGVGHQPDFIWVKQRGDAGYDHSLHNSVSGLLKQLISNSTATEITNTDTITSNNSDGFVLGADTAGPNANSNNQDTKNYVAWNWKANGTGVANTDGSISSTVSASATSGFSIVKYSGDGGSSSTVGHGLNAIPKFVTIKCITSTPSWQCWGDGYTRLSLNNPDADLGSNGMTRGASTVTLPSGINDWNGSGQDYIMYCWSEVKGFSKFGSYTGNGSTDGTFVYTGFKPAFVMMKSYSHAVNWKIEDSKRNQPFNDGYGASINANENSAEDNNTAYDIDILSNGFKQRNTNSNMNNPGYTYIYMAFAEEPLVGDNPATAR